MTLQSICYSRITNLTNEYNVNRRPIVDRYQMQSYICMEYVYDQEIDLSQMYVLVFFFFKFWLWIDLYWCNWQLFSFVVLSSIYILIPTMIYTYNDYLSDIHIYAIYSQINGLTMRSYDAHLPWSNVLQLDERDFYHMMTSSNGNIFRVTGPLCGEFTGHRLIPRTKASEAELCCFLSSVPE